MNNVTSVQIPQNVLDFYKELTAVQDSYKPLTKVDLSGVNLEKQLTEGNCALIKGALSFNFQQIRNIINDVTEVLAKHRVEIKEDIVRQKEYFNSIPDDQLKVLLEEFIFQKDLESLKEQTLAREVTILILLNSIKPYMRMVAQDLKDLEVFSLWAESKCPICGWDPLLAKIDENGKRALHCALCDYDWQFKALKCIHCGSENHERLQLLTITGVEGRELQVCNECNSYVKQVKTKEVIVEKNLSLEDVKTLYLDLIAEKEGYKNIKI